MYISICIGIHIYIYICCNMHTCTCVKNNLRTMKPCSCRIFQLLALKFSSKRPLPFDLQQLGWWWMVDVNNPSLSIVGYRIPIFFIVESSIDDLISLFKFLPISLRKGNLWASNFCSASSCMDCKKTNRASFTTSSPWHWQDWTIFMGQEWQITWLHHAISSCET